MGRDDHLTSLSSQNALSKTVDQGCSSSQLKKIQKVVLDRKSLVLIRENSVLGAAMLEHGGVFFGSL